MPPHPATRTGCRPGPSSASLVLVAANLRTLMASLPPLAQTIRADLGLSSAWMGVLTTLPVLCMGLLAPVANQVARRVGTATAVGGGITLVLAGLVLRGIGGGQVWSLYAGTVVAGAGIALAGTLLPGVVKTVFPALPLRAGHRADHGGDDGPGRRGLGHRGSAGRRARWLVGIPARLGAARGTRPARLGADGPGGAAAHRARTPSPPTSRTRCRGPA